MSMRKLQAVFFAVVMCLFHGAAHAAVITMTVGDEDCFGGPVANCTAGAFPTIPAAFDNSTAGDPVGTDRFGTLGTTSFDFHLDTFGETINSATVTVRVLGIDIFIEPGGGGDANVGATFAMNGSIFGTFHEPIVIGSDINQRAITTVEFALDVSALLNGGINTLRIMPESNFGLAQFESYAIDYARLSVTTSARQLPLPGSLALVTIGIAMLGLPSRRSKKSN